MTRWGGRLVTALRAAWAPRVEAGLVVCWRCGLLITPGQDWDLGHRIARADGGTDDPTQKTDIPSTATATAARAPAAAAAPASGPGCDPLVAATR